MDKLSKENQKLISDVDRLQGLSTFSSALNELETKLLEMESKLKQANEWISVEDRLPDNESGYRVLVFCNDIVSSWAQILHHNGKFFLQEGGGEFPPIVTHWMPLPKPPTGE